MTPFLAAFMAVLGLQSPASPASPWGWALYDGETLVLAEEDAASSRLRHTLECRAGSGLARLTLFEFGAASGFARFAAGGAQGAVESRSSGGDVSLTLRIDHPAFVAFARDGAMTIAVAGRERRVEVGRSHLSRLRSFAEQCAG